MKVIIDKKTLEFASTLALSQIIQRTSEGKDQAGKPFKPYSTKPFAMPLGAYKQNTTQRQRKNLKDRDLTQIITSKRTGNKWILIKGGYAAFKYARFPSRSGKVDLQVRGMRGGMLSNLQVIKIGENSFTIGFTTEEMRDLAKWNIAKGRDFLGLTKEEQEELIRVISEGVSIDFSDLPNEV